MTVDARVRDAEGAGSGSAVAGNRAGWRVPWLDAKGSVPPGMVRHQPELGENPILDAETLEGTPVGPCLNEGQAHPGLPLQGGNAVHWARRLDISRQRQATENVTDGAELALRRLVQERRNFLLVTRDEEEALPGLGEAAEFTAIMGRFRHGIAVAPKQGDDLLEKTTAPAGDARDVLEEDEFRRIVLEGFQGEPHAAQRESVQGLVFVREAQRFREQAGEAFARCRQEDDMRAFSTRGALDVLWPCGTPPERGRSAVEGGVLVGVEEIEHRAGNAGQPFEIPNGGRRHVDAAEAAEYGLHVADAGAAAVEAAGPAAEAAEQMKVADFAKVDRGGIACRHGASPCRMTPSPPRIPPARGKGAPRRAPSRERDGCLGARPKAVPLRRAAVMR